MRAHATKLIEITERNAADIAKKWLKDVRANPRTPSYQGLSEDRALEHAVEFYSHFRALFCTEKPFQEARKFFSKYADERFAEGIPLHEALYALILMRRHIWLYAEFQAIFITAVIPDIDAFSQQNVGVFSLYLDEAAESTGTAYGFAGQQPRVLCSVPVVPG